MGQSDESIGGADLRWRRHRFGSLALGTARGESVLFGTLAGFDVIEEAFTQRSLAPSLARRQDLVAAFAQPFEIAMFPDESAHRHEGKRALVLRQCVACRGKPQFVHLLVHITGDRGGHRERIHDGLVA